MASDVDNLGPVPLLLVTLHGESLQPRSHYRQQTLDVLELHGDQVQLREVVQPEERVPHQAVLTLYDRRLVVHHQVDLPQVGTAGHHQVNVVSDLGSLGLVQASLVANLLGRLVAVPQHFFPDILELVALRHEADVRLAEVVSITGITELLYLEVLVF